MSKKTSGILVAVMIILIAMTGAGIGTGLLPKEMGTILLGVSGFVLSFADFRAGMLLLLVMLYYPVLPNVDIGAYEFSVTTIPVLGLGLKALILKQDSDTGPKLTRWQVLLLAGLLAGFTLATLLSTNINTSILLAPNLYLYVILLFAFMVLIRRPEQLVWIIKVILLLTLVSVFYREELRPIRGYLGLKSLGVNGHIYQFYTAVALSLVIGTNQIDGFSRPWRFLAFFLLGMMGLRAVQLETRAAWIAIPAVILISLRYFKIRNAIAIAVILLLGSMFVNYYSDIINRNLTLTQKVYAGIVGDGDISDMDGADQARLIAKDAAMAMFRERPLFGWGPNMYIPLKPQFAVGPTYMISGTVAGCFNSWAMVIAEMGLAGLLPILLTFLCPLILSLRTINKRTSTALLAYAFGAGAIGYGIHLLFIDLLYASFVWMQLGIGLAAARIAYTYANSEPDHANGIA